MFKLRDSISNLVDQINTFLPDMLESRGYTNWRSPTGRRQKDNRQIMKQILETSLYEADAIKAMEVVESFRTESSTGGYNCHRQSLHIWAKEFIHQCCNARRNIELALVALSGNCPDATWAAGTAARVKSESRLFESAPIDEQDVAINRTRSAGLNPNPRLITGRSRSK